MSHKINISIRKNMRNKIIKGAVNYQNHLIDKDFMIICKDGKIHNVRFFKKDFQHLTGLLSDLSEIDFFERCLNGSILVSNILEDQKYNISTLRYKTKKIEIIDKIIYGNTNNSLFMINLHTNTGDFPVAIRNKDISTCIGFRGNGNRARTLRKYSNSSNADEQLEIIAIFGKHSSDKLYSEKVFLKDKDILLKTRSDVLNKLTNVLQQDIVNIQSSNSKNVITEKAM